MKKNRCGRKDRDSSRFAGRRYLIAVVVLLLVPALRAQEGWQACRGLSDSQERLVCYDRLVDGLASEAGDVATIAPVEDEPETLEGAANGSAPVTTASAAVAATSEANPAVTEDAAAAASEAEFGLEFDVKEAQQQMSSTVTAVTRNVHGRLILTLENGQVWQQSGGERLYMKEGQAITVHRGALTSFYVSLSEKGRRYRFARIR